MAELPLRLVDGYPIVTASLADRPVSLLLDTGAQGMLVTPAIVEALRLPSAGVTRVDGTGGSRLAPVVRLPNLRLGGTAMPDLLAPVVALPAALTLDPPFAGLLGAILLASFDLDIDVPGGRMALWSPGDCAAPPWRGTTLPLAVSPEGEAFAPVRINGQMLLALLDTGSRASILADSTARRLGLGAPISANTAPGVDGARLPVGHTRVRFSLGEETPADTPISIAPLQLDHGDMLLGLDQLGQRRFWLSYATGVVVVAAR